MVGREIEDGELRAAAPPASRRCWRCEGLSLPWPGHAQRLAALRTSALERARAARCSGIAGLMGAGRTELLECLFGASRVAAARDRSLLDGRDRCRSAIRPRPCAAGVALVTEDRKRLGPVRQMNVGENITICHARADAGTLRA